MCKIAFGGLVAKKLQVSTIKKKRKMAKMETAYNKECQKKREKSGKHPASTQTVQAVLDLEWS